jgi:thiol-disulfide isomerase/thioredoxin/outer membrane lipoprotein-sorting protein
MRNVTIFALAGLVLAGCSREAASPVASVEGKSPKEFLQWSMDQYAAMPSFQAKMTVSTKSDGKDSPDKQKREVFLQGANQFKIVASTPNGLTQTAISDGKHLVEYASEGQPQAVSYPAPARIGEAGTTSMRHPMMFGTLLYQFFGGSAKYADLVDEEKGKVEFGSEEKGPGGEPAQIVKFFGRQTYGNVQALIGKESGKVYRLTYDSAPLIERIKQMIDLRLKEMPEGEQKEAARKQMETGVPSSFVTEEIYDEVKPGAKIAAATFDTAPPKGMKLVDATVASSDATPLPLGKPAPAFAVKTLDGKPVTLASLRGKVVMIDFWATWCGPCREGLPETEKIAKEGADKGLQVLAISDEKADVVSDFMKANGYKMPTFLDEGSKTMRTYKVDGIPCTVIIDAEGNLRSYLVGLNPPETIRAELAKAGAKL